MLLPRATARADSETQGCVVQGPDTEGSWNPRVFNPSPESHHNYFFTQGGGAGVGGRQGGSGTRNFSISCSFKKKMEV